MKDSPNLDLLRSIAVAIVVLSHIGKAIGIDREAMIFFGLLGVVVFFVHTCLVLMLSLERHGSAAGPFFIRRFFRIYPLAVVVVLFVAASKWLGGAPPDKWMVLTNVALVQNLTGHESDPYPLWSLPYEVQMYLVLPALYVMTLSRGPWRIAALWLAVIVLVGAMMAMGLHASPIDLVPCFLAGVLAYTLQRTARAHLSPVVLFCVLGIGVAACMLLWAAGVHRAPLCWALSLALGLTIPYCRQMQPGLLTAGAKTIATYSYGIYLTHVFAIGFAFYLFPSLHIAGKFAFCMLVLVAFARVTYRWIEQRSSPRSAPGSGGRRSCRSSSWPP
jgi:peptidoglycan/LPS O-acetylase OafA/YrhL